MPCLEWRAFSDYLWNSLILRVVDDRRGHSADKIAFWIGDTLETVRSVYAHMLEASSAPAAAIDQALAGLG